MHGGATYASPDKKRGPAQGGDGEYSYAATTTVVGSKLEPKHKAREEPGGERKVTEDESARPEKPKRGSKKQPAPSDVPHKQGPAGDVYAMPNKKVPEVGHKAGPQGDMYTVSAKPSKVSDHIHLMCYVWH